jgi:hypothetical protein
MIDLDTSSKHMDWYGQDALSTHAPQLKILIKKLNEYIPTQRTKLDFQKIQIMWDLICYKVFDYQKTLWFVKGGFFHFILYFLMISNNFGHMHQQFALYIFWWMRLWNMVFEKTNVLVFVVVYKPFHIFPMGQTVNIDIHHNRMAQHTYHNLQVIIFLIKTPSFTTTKP